MPQYTGILFIGHLLVALMGLLGGLLAVSGVLIFFRPGLLPEKVNRYGLRLAVILFLLGLVLIGWLHFRIYADISLSLPEPLAAYLNRMLAAANRGRAYGLPLYDPAAPPRYLIPPWIENEKYYFWFGCFVVIAAVLHRRAHTRFGAALAGAAGVHLVLLALFFDPFTGFLPRFFAEITPWFDPALAAGERVGLFMRLYPRLLFYYNASYMWLHPPLLFVSYAAVTMVFIASLFMLAGRDEPVEKLAYSQARLGFLLLTLGMLLGYPWALTAWGPNWWWDPKIASSIMMWAVFATWLHTRLYLNRPSMWYLSSLLGILCFVAMVFTFLASFFFPGQHTFQ